MGRSSSEQRWKNGKLYEENGMKEQALQYLRMALGNSDAEFRPGQWEAIAATLARKRLLLVQRTGWGKSLVYFIATRLLRDGGAGITVLVSPLLSLMRNQLQAAKPMGLQAETINSTNRDQWRNIEQQLRADRIDILLVAPERLADNTFLQNVLAHVADRVGLFVVDEAHCISDWGHEFRPDYRRIVRVLRALPSNVPVLATTATANDRVVDDVVSQLGVHMQAIRGPLMRDTLKLQNITLSSPAARMAWLAQAIPSLPGSGVVYTLTRRDSERVAEWLRESGISAEAYHSDLKGQEAQTSSREALEQKLLRNEVKALVATVALGMGFDKPDLGFVIHYQRPASVVHYYQQVGRAGRAVDEAFGILLHGDEDDEIADFFIESAFPPERHVDAILKELEKADSGLSLVELEARVNVRHRQLDKALKVMSVESPSPITKIGSKWHATATAKDYSINREHVERITEIRRQEQAEMKRYMEHSGCLMEFLSRALDDPQAGPCGRCANCEGEPLVSHICEHDLVSRAVSFLKKRHRRVAPRKSWPKGAFPVYGFTGRISDDLRAEEGRALCLWGDVGWGKLVAAGKYEDRRFADELVTACAEMIREWNPQPAPAWTACIPSLNRPELVSGFALRLADALGVPFHPCIRKTESNKPQREMENRFQQARNLDGVFAVDVADVQHGPCILVDDVVDSRWTVTVAAALLRQAGCAAVFPLALAMGSGRSDDKSS